MTELDLILQVKVQTTVDSEFQVVKKKNGVVYFKSLRFPKHKYLLNYEVLTEFEILEVAKILKEVYSKISYQSFSYDRYDTKVEDDKAPVSLNQNSESSGELVGAIVDLPAAAIHKLLLLSSANSFISSCDPELVISLAKLKNEVDIPFKIFTDDYILEVLKDLYVLPGVTDKTVKVTGNTTVSTYHQEEFEQTIRLMAFLANDSDTKILSEHLDLDLQEAIVTQGSLNGYERINTLQMLLSSEYEKLMLSMTASELVSLAKILLQEPANIRHPEDILKSRCAAMEKDVKRLPYLQKDSIVRYLSKEEQSQIKSQSFSDDVNSLITSQDVKSVNPPIIYAALAEVFAVRGEKSVLQVSKELVHLKLSRDRNRKMYAATVLLIAEALKPEAVDYPFSWYAQMSEHAWVLTDHIRQKKVNS
jgi:hypothetical protein